MPEDRLQYLVDKLQAGNCTPEEIEELEEEMLLQFRRRLDHQDFKNQL